MEDIVLGTGLVLGSLALLSVFFVWIRKQTFGTGGSILSVVGLILIGMSLWSNIRFRISAEGFEASLEAIESRVEQVADAGTDIAETLTDVTRNLETAQTQFVALTQVLERRQVAPAQMQALRRPIESAAVIDPARLQRATQALVARRPQR